jgi:hypothetical protein
VHPLNRRHDARRFLVIGRQQQGRSYGDLARYVAIHDTERPAASRQYREEPSYGTGESERDPGEQADEQCEQNDFECGQATDCQHAIHLARGKPGHHDRTAEYQAAAREEAGYRGASASFRRVHMELLAWHGERRVRRERCEVCPRRVPQPVQRKIQASVTGPPSPISCARNSTAFSSCGASSKLMRQLPSSGFRCTTMLDTAPLSALTSR